MAKIVKEINTARARVGPNQVLMDDGQILKVNTQNAPSYINTGDGYGYARGNSGNTTARTVAGLMGAWWQNGRGGSGNGGGGGIGGGEGGGEPPVPGSGNHGGVIILTQQEVPFYLAIVIMQQSNTYLASPAIYETDLAAFENLSIAYPPTMLKFRVALTSPVFFSIGGIDQCLPFGYPQPCPMYNINREPLLSYTDFVGVYNAIRGGDTPDDAALYWSTAFNEYTITYPSNIEFETYLQGQGITTDVGGFTGDRWLQQLTTLVTNYAISL